MSPDAELSSLATDLDGLLARLTSLSDELGGIDRDRLGGDLYEVERMLSAARRHLGRLLDGTR